MNEKTVLVVEDELPLQEAICTKLKASGFSVLCARAVREAMDHMEKAQKIDAIWLDHYLLGNENGLDFVAELKKEGSKWRRIPIFVVSNTAGADKVRSYMEFGVEKYYVKSDYRLDNIITNLKGIIENDNTN